jgi:glycosyltransferase involved in cell wall biosynthesis
MNILIIGTQSSIHDLKWITYLSSNSHHKFYFISETPVVPLSDKQRKQYADAGVILLNDLPRFSLNNILKTLSGFLRLSYIVHRYKIDCAHVLFATPHIFWTTFFHIPVIVTTRGSDVLVVTKNLLEQKTITAKILCRLLTFNYNKSLFITCTSEIQKEFLENHFPLLKNEISVIRTGIDIDYIARQKNQSQRDDRFVIFYPRFIKPIYNILNQIKAIKKLPAEVQNNLKLIIVRSRHPNFQYENLVIDELREVHFDYEIKEFMSNDVLIQTYLSSNLVIMTPLSDGTPNSALEAMACKKPLIVSDLQYDNALFNNTCLKADPKNIDDIMIKIKTAIENYPNSLISNAFEAVTKHGDQKVEMKKIINLYEKVSANAS